MGNLCCLPNEEESRVDNSSLRQATVQPLAITEAPRLPARGTHEVAVRAQRQKEELRAIEKAIDDRFAASRKALSKRQPKGELQTINFRKLIETQLPKPGEICSKVLSKNPEFGPYLDGTHFTDCPPREYAFVNSLFTSTTQRHYEVVTVQKIFNPHLQASYLLRKHEYCLLYGKDKVKEELLFHGTKFSNVDGISTFNLNWRLNGKNQGHLYGQGANFTPIANYASNYSDDEEVNVMFVFTMLYCNFCDGTKNMVMPPVCDSAVYPNARVDTSTKPNYQVMVKFRDDEFYPSYLIKYKGRPIKRVHTNLNDDNCEVEGSGRKKST